MKLIKALDELNALLRHEEKLKTIIIPSVDEQIAKAEKELEYITSACSHLFIVKKNDTTMCKCVRCTFEVPLVSKARQKGISCIVGSTTYSVHEFRQQVPEAVLKSALDEVKTPANLRLKIERLKRRKAKHNKELELILDTYQKISETVNKRLAK